MSDTLNFTEIGTQHIELLPARTVMSIFRTAPAGGTSTSPTSGGAGASGSTPASGKGTFLEALGQLATAFLKDPLGAGKDILGGLGGK
jgi:hypothetical protein